MEETYRTLLNQETVRPESSTFLTTSWHNLYTYAAQKNTALQWVGNGERGMMCVSSNGTTDDFNLVCAFTPHYTQNYQITILTTLYMYQQTLDLGLNILVLNNYIGFLDISQGGIYMVCFTSIYKFIYS